MANQSYKGIETRSKSNEAKNMYQNREKEWGS